MFGVLLKKSTVLNCLSIKDVMSMNREDRIEMDKIKKTLQEAIKEANRDSDRTTCTEDLAYYQGLAEGYGHVYEVLRKLK